MNLQITVEAIDRASAILDAVRQKTAAFTDTAAAVESAGAYGGLEAALGRVGTTQESVRGTTEESIGTLGRLREVVESNRLAEIALIAVEAAAPAAIVEMTRGATENAAQLHEMSVATGLTTEFLSGLDLAARESGTSLEGIQTGFRTLSQQMVQAVDPTSQAARSFQLLGVNLREFPNDANGIQALFLKLLDGFAGLENGFGKTALAVQLFGRAGEQLLPFLEKGSAGIQELTQKAEELGLVVSGETAEAAKKLQNSLTELGGVFRGIGNDLSAAINPPLTALVAFATAHSAGVKTAFLGIAGAVSTLGAALLTIKAVNIADTLLTAIGGSVAIAQATTASQLVGVLGEGFKNLALQTRLFALDANLALGLSFAGKIGLATVAVGGLTAAVFAGIEGWKAWQAAKEQALTQQSLGDQNLALKKKTEDQIDQAVAGGQLSEDKAKEFRNRLFQAFVPSKEVQTIDFSQTGFSPTGPAIKTTFERDLENEHGGLKTVNQDLREQLGLRRQIDDPSLITAQTRIDVEKNLLEIFKAQQSLKAAQVDSASKQPFSTVTPEQRSTELRKIEEDTVKTSQETLTKIENLVIQEARRKVQESPEVKALPEEERAIAVEKLTQNERTKIQSDFNLQRETIEIESKQRLLAINDDRTQAEIDVDKRSAQSRITILEATNNEIVAQELKLNQKVREIEEQQRGLAVDDPNRLRPGQIQAAAAAAQAKQNQLDLNKGAEQQLSILQSVNDVKIKLLQSDPNPDKAAVQRQLNEALKEQIGLLQQQIDKNRELIQQNVLKPEELQAKRDFISLTLEQVAATQKLIDLGNLKGDDLLASQKKVELLKTQIELTKQQIDLGTKLKPEELASAQNKITQAQGSQVDLNRQRNLQDPIDKQLPSFSGSLGFQNSVDQFGNKTSGRELVAPFKALDDFLSGTLQTTFRSLGDSVTGLITGATTWAQVWTQAGNQIIGMVVQLILEYTVFHVIRTALDKLFHTGARANIATTSQVGQTAQTTAAATGAASAGTVAAASAPAAAATSIWSFGSAPAIGLILALAAIAAIVAALAFAKGGVVPTRQEIPRFASGGVLAGTGVFTGPGGERDDQIQTLARPGTGIINAPAMRFYGGAKFIKDLENGTLGLTDQTKAPVTRNQTSVPSGAPVPIRVSPGEGWIAPEIVAKFGGARFIAALNNRLIPSSVFQQFSSLATIAASGGRFAHGGTVETVRERLLGQVDSSLLPQFQAGGTVIRSEMDGLDLIPILPTFASGGLIGPLDLSGFSIEVSHFESGGVVDGGGASRAAQVSQALQAKLESNPTVNVQSPQVVLLKSADEILEVLRSNQGRVVIMDLLTGMKSDLGIRS